jgi:hypothetical protein
MSLATAACTNKWRGNLHEEKKEVMTCFFSYSPPVYPPEPVASKWHYPGQYAVLLYI